MPEILNKEVYEKLALQMEDMKLNIRRAEDLRDSLREVGEETSEIEARISELRQKVGRWETVLRRRGFID